MQLPPRTNMFMRATRSKGWHMSITSETDVMYLLAPPRQWVLFSMRTAYFPIESGTTRAVSVTGVVGMFKKQMAAFCTVS